MVFTGDSLTAVVDGVSVSANSTHPNWAKIVDAAKARRWASLPKLCEVGKAIKAWAKGRAEIRDGQVVYNGEVVHNTLTNRILDMISGGFDAKPMLRFLENLMLNPSADSRNELYGFLEYGKLPITDDGCFLAYRVVDKDFMSKHPNPDGSRNRNMVGDEVSMDRGQVDNDRNRTCSSGLHFCALEYAPKYGAYGTDRLMIVKINPMDVVSIPVDYNNTKGRCCRYEVVMEYKGEWEKSAFDSPVYSSDGGEYEPEEDEWEDWDEEDEWDDDDDSTDPFGIKPSGQRYWNVRDESGKFARG